VKPLGHKPIGIVVSVLSILSISCSGSGGSPDPEHSADAAETDFEPIDGMYISADQQAITPEDQIVIRDAEGRLVQRCMKEQGFDYDPNGIVMMPPTAPMYLSPDELRRSGYQYDWEAAGRSYLANNGPDGPPNPLQGMSQSEQDAYLDALVSDAPEDQMRLAVVEGEETTSPTKGCGPEAKIELFGSIANYLRYNHAVEFLSRRAVSRELLKSDEYASAAAEWRRCMQQQGFAVEDGSGDASPDDYGYPYVYRLGVDLVTGSGGLTGDEFLAQVPAIANADADCSESSGLHEVRERLRSDAEEAVAADLGFELSQYVAFQNAILERAKAVP
jgi:hypothetical protein